MITIPYSVISFFIVVLFALVHLLASKTRGLNKLTHGRFLSMGGGVAIAYVFIDLLPKLCKGDKIVTQAFSGVFPYFERHVYIMALAGFLLFFIVDRTHSLMPHKKHLRLSLFSYALFNFLVAYAVADQNNPEIRPLGLFAFAMALHYFTNDYTLTKTHPFIYDNEGKWFLIASLFCGWLVGLWFDLSETALALVSAFIGGGVIMNVTRHELPKDNPHSLGAFLLGAFAYTAILLGIG